VVRYDDTIDAASTIAPFDQSYWRTPTPPASKSYATTPAIPDRSKAVQQYLKDSRIKLVFLPTYAPKRNLIERLWKFVKKQVLYNRYYATNQLRNACKDFFNNRQCYRGQLRHC